MVNRKKYEIVTNINDITNDVYIKLMDDYLSGEYHYDSIEGRDENEVLLSIYNEKYVGEYVDSYI